MNGELFAALPAPPPRTETIGPGTALLHGFAMAEAPLLYEEIQRITAAAPFRQMQIPGGHRMSVAMSNCGQLGWISDCTGYRYSPTDPLDGQPWPALPEAFRQLAKRAAEAAGFAGFDPDACLINRYEPGARMALHQDRDERDLSAPIVSVSLGLPAIFKLGGQQRSDRAIRLRLEHGDVLVWGGPDRLRFHGVLALKPGCHPLLDACRINLTFRRAG